jgi:hypothetical protein
MCCWKRGWFRGFIGDFTLLSRVRGCFMHHAGSMKDTAPLSAVTLGSTVCTSSWQAYLAYSLCLHTDIRRMKCQGYVKLKNNLVDWDDVKPGRSSPTFRSNLLSATSFCYILVCFLLGLLFSPQDGGNTKRRRTFAGLHGVTSLKVVTLLSYRCDNLKLNLYTTVA